MDNKKSHNSQPESDSPMPALIEEAEIAQEKPLTTQMNGIAAAMPEGRLAFLYPYVLVYDSASHRVLPPISVLESASSAAAQTPPAPASSNQASFVANMHTQSSSSSVATPSSSAATSSTTTPERRSPSSS